MLLTKLPVAVGLAGVALAANAVTYTPGTYTEKVNGHNAAFTVKVTVSKTRLKRLNILTTLKPSVSAKSLWINCPRRLSIASLSA